MLLLLLDLIREGWVARAVCGFLTIRFVLGLRLLFWGCVYESAKKQRLVLIADPILPNFLRWSSLKKLRPGCFSPSSLHRLMRKRL